MDISMDDGSQYFLAPAARNQHPSVESMRPVSPQSLSSPNVSRSNTLNTMSSKKSSSSTGTHRSEERIPSLPKSKTAGTFSPSSQKNGSIIDAMDKGATVSSAPSGMGHSQWTNDVGYAVNTRYWSFLTVDVCLVKHFYRYCRLYASHVSLTSDTRRCDNF